MHIPLELQLAEHSENYRFENEAEIGMNIAFCMSFNL